MEEGEIANENINSPKAELFKEQEITKVEEKGIEDEKVSELSKVEDGEIEDNDEDEKRAAESSDVPEDKLPDSTVEKGIEDEKVPELSKVEDGEIKDDEDEKMVAESSDVSEDKLADSTMKEDGAIRNDNVEKKMVTELSGIVEERASESTKEEGERIRGDRAENIVIGSSDIDHEKVAEVEEGEIEDDVDAGEKIVTLSLGEISQDEAHVETENGGVACVDPTPEHQDYLKSQDSETREPLVEKKDVPAIKDGPVNMQETDATVLESNTETEEGELNDSSDEKEEKNVEPTIGISKDSSPVEKGGVAEVKNSVSKIEFGMDESRPEEEQLDYDEDELEEKTKAAAPAPTEPSRPIQGETKNKSDGEVDSGSEGEIKSEEEEGADFEEGETRDHPLDLPPERKKVCKFFEMGNCTWGDRCRYLHPGVNDKGNYDMFNEPPKPGRGRNLPPHFHSQPQHPPPPGPFWGGPPPFMPPVLPVAETAWEKGLRNAKELKKRALQRKVQEPDFLQKREVLSLNVALNEDRDMEFVNHKPLSENNKGFNPFQEEDEEYATPTPEEVRRQMMQDRRRGAPPPHRHPLEKDHRPSPPEHIMPPDMRRGRRPPSPRHPGTDRYLPDMRRMSPRRDNERERRPNIPPNNPGLLQRHGDRRDHRNYPDRSDNRGQFPNDPTRRDFPADRVRNDKFPDDTKGPKRLQNGAPVVQGEQWSDPWARGRPPMKGTSTNKDASSSSGSSSDSSSRSSSHSSNSSHSSFSGSSRSSSRSSGSSRSSSFSSNHDSSRSPSPSKNSKPKKKVLNTAKQRNAVAGAPKKPPVTGGAPKLAPSKPVPTVKTEQSSGPKTLPVVSKKPPDKKLVVPLPSNVPKQAVAKKNIKLKKRTSSSSSEFSRSSDSSSSPSRVKAKGGSDSDSASSSSSSSFSSSGISSSSDSDEDDKPRNRRTGKSAGKPPLAPKGQIPLSVTVRPIPLQQQNKGKVMVPSKPGRKDVKMTIIDKPGVPKKRTAAEMTGQAKKPSSRRTELLEQLRAVEDAIARKRAKIP